MLNNITSLFKDVAYYCIGLFFRCCFSMFPLKDKIVFTAYSGLRYDCNPKAISVKLHELHPEIEQVWLMRANYSGNLPDYIRVVRYGSFSMFKELMTSKAWIDNGTKSMWACKRRGQFFLETWHGGLGFKRIGSDVIGYAASDLRRDKHSFKMADALLSNSTYLTDIMLRIHPYFHGEIWEVGSPKSDALFNKKAVESAYFSVRANLGIDSSTKVLLYAPTFKKDDTTLSCFSLDFKLIVETLQQHTKSKWIVLVKLHHLSQHLAPSLPHDFHYVIDVTSYSDIIQLTMAADVYLTDYSSGIFDFALLRRPGFLFTPDLDYYSSNERGLYVQPYETPFPVAMDEKELLLNLVQFNEKEYQQGLDTFFVKSGLVLSGSSAASTCDRLIRSIYAN